LKILTKNINGLFFLIAFLCFGQNVIAQSKTAKQKADSLKEAMQLQRDIRDSITEANKNKTKLAIAERRRISDSTIDSRKTIRDSITDARETARKDRDKIAKQKSSKKYLKEQEKIRQNKTDSIAYVRKIRSDSLKYARKEQTESLAEQRKVKLETITKKRKESADSIANFRKENLAKIKETRKKISDSVAKVRKVFKDSIAVVKNKKLEKLKKLYKSAEQLQQELAMKKHEQKKSVYSNQNFLKKPWSINRKLYQNTVTRYNYYYNAKKLYDEAVENNRKNSKDDYAKLLSLESILQSGSSAGGGGGNMDSVIRKCAMSIQIHDPRSKWFDDLYLLMGKAYIMKGETDNAIMTFQYVANEYKEKPEKEKPLYIKGVKVTDTTKKFSIASIESKKIYKILEHKPVRNDALVWLAKTYLQAGAFSEAQTLIGIMDLDPKFPTRLKADVDLLSAQLYMLTNSPAQAITALQNALKDKTMSKSVKMKITFLLGQLLAKDDQFEKSNIAFEKVITMHPNVDMDFYAKLNLAKNAAKLPNSDLSKIESMFKTIINDGKYINYLDKAYLTLGAIQAETNANKAIETLNKAIAKSKTNRNTKEEAYGILGDLYFKQTQYKASKFAYDSALVNATDMTLEKNINMDIRRNLLNDLVKELNVISYNDSLINLASLSKKEQIAKAKKAWKAEKKASDKKEEVAPIENNVVPEKTIVSSWYFGNASNVEQGKKTFETKWGNRPNVDNWRRVAAIAAGNLTKGDEDINKDKEDEITDENKEETQSIDKYLNVIPNTPDALANCNASRENAIYNASVIYYAGLNDDIKTIEYLNQLLKDYPTTSYLSKAYYSLYLANKRIPNKPEADRYLALLQDNYPDEQLTKIASNPESAMKNLDAPNDIMAYYSTTYDIYKDNKFAEVLPRIEYAKQNYASHPLYAKFALLEAMSTTSMRKYEKARLQLADLITKYTGNEEATLAQDILALLNAKDTSGNDTTGIITKLEPSFSKKNTITKYSYEPNQPHYYMFILKEIDDRISPLKSAFGDFNTIKHSTETIESSLYLIDQNSGVVFFKQFVNEKIAKKYLNEVLDNKNLYSVFKASEYEMAIISENNYTYFKNTRDLQGYLKFYKINYK
jgi:Tetratricopeptide repeat